MDEKMRTVTWMLVMLVLGVILGIVLMSAARQTHPAPIVIEAPLPTTTAAPTATGAPLRVYISGAVQRPDVYLLPPGSIIRDLVQAAGDFVPDAAVESVNLAQPLADGMQVHVPVRTEAAATPPVVSGAPLPINSLDGGAVAPASALVNINTASLAELDTLPGIGPATAQKIIDYRESNGPFATIEAIQQVSGIGPAKFEALATLITVD